MIKYEESSSNRITITKGWSDFFLNDQENCPISKCEVKNADCNTDYVDELVNISSSYPFELETKTNTPLGSKVEVCFKCKNQN